MFRHFSHSAQSWKTWGIAGGPGACLCSADLHRWFVPDGSRCNGSFVAEDPEQNSSYRDHYLVRFELQLHSMSLFKQIMLSQDEHSAPPIAWSSLCRVCHWTCPLLRFEFRSNFMPQHDTTAPAGTSIPSYPIPFFDILWWLVIIGWLKCFQLVMTCHDITHVIQLIPTDSNWYLWWRSKVLFVGSPARPDVSRCVPWIRGSRIQWIQVCTANELDTIPGPLLDRMEALETKFAKNNLMIYIYMLEREIYR